MVVAEGQRVGVTVVKEFVAEWRRRRLEVFVPLVYRPGDLGEVDFFEVLVREELPHAPPSSRGDRRRPDSSIGMSSLPAGPGFHPGSDRWSLSSQSKQPRAWPDRSGRRQATWRGRQRPKMALRALFFSQ